MDKLTRYREIIQKILKSYSDRRSDDIVESQTIFDAERDHCKFTHYAKSCFNTIVIFLLPPAPCRPPSLHDKIFT